MFRVLSLLICLLIAGSGAFAQERSIHTVSALFVFMYVPGPKWIAGKPMELQDLREHAVYHSQLVKEGRSFAAGGFVGQDGGMAIIRAHDFAEADAIRDADPAIRSGVFEVRITRWMPRFVTSDPLIAAAPRLAR
jgi:uncharacterized protein